MDDETRPTVEQLRAKSMDEPAYPADGDFRLRQRTVHASCYDGTTAGAHQILAWVYRKGGTGRLESGFLDQGPDLLYIGNSKKQVIHGSWVVEVPGKGFEIWSDTDFRIAYEPIPPGPIYRG